MTVVKILLTWPGHLKLAGSDPLSFQFIKQENFYFDNLIVSDVTNNSKEKYHLMTWKKLWKKIFSGKNVKNSYFSKEVPSSLMLTSFGKTFFNFLVWPNFKWMLVRHKQSFFLFVTGEKFPKTKSFPCGFRFI